MASSELELKGRNKKALELSLSLSIGMVLLGLSLMLYLRRRKKRNHRLRSCDKQKLRFSTIVNGSNQVIHTELTEILLLLFYQVKSNSSLLFQAGKDTTKT
ncbi:Hypothetical predicted protein [Olea europaea subsp. europaea]|uniref:Uncharacterized protein n=1 Tax=Olea europaea subsp. europaea TaxID=158383 RepID=A0A8S0RUZ8_OLEEU|nr:Hypothetical predicted protein [Olea europaea subsp. europaea]